MVKPLDTVPVLVNRMFPRDRKLTAEAARSRLPPCHGACIAELKGSIDARKPSPNTRVGLVFYAALGIPLLLAPPVGIHETYNLATAAWAGYRRLPSRGLYQIAERVRG
jgi:hypothetical protein